MQERLKIGQIVNTVGLKGFVRVVPYTDDNKRFELLESVYLVDKKHYKKYDIEDVKYQKNLVLLKFKNINDINSAEKLKNLYIEIDRKDAVKLPENTYFIVDLIGLDIVNVDNNALLGKIEDVFSTKSNDVYVVKNDEGKQILIPAIKSVVKNVDLENKKVTVKLIEGLI